ncbi:WhiB family transcriptional regulator [Ornithinimicrobium sufpigmenti]|uniref:WhiB family transcriptional regulator n=1 Tax=Ornithinimicrobium sufpigmenti TaxID=2508882 RepID=UPI001EDDEFB0|nr:MULTISPECIES: WhiB family transcriptional regulator [unclassified Ornithinimicrobium]
MSTVSEPIAELWEWQHKGLCRTMNPELFFHPEAERGPSRRRRDQRATAVCEQCPVLAECREHALRVREPYGVWGGLTEEDREAILRGEPISADLQSREPDEDELSA